jgi:membrane protease YdiL (CAAX protease family)
MNPNVERISYSVSIQDPMSTAITPQPENHAVAPAWHTVLVVLIMLGLSVLSAYSQALPSVGNTKNRISRYITSIAMEWLMLGFIWIGLRLRKQRLRVLLGGNWGGLRQISRDFGIAVLFLIVSYFVLGLLSHLLKAAPNAAIRGLLPHTPGEIAVFALLTVSAGICEEMIFRGYLQRQFSTFFRSTAAGVVLQGIVFGAAHGYQGPKLMLVIVVFGVMFGMLAQSRRSLRPGMFAHFLQDLVTGIAAGRFMR